MDLVLLDISLPRLDGREVLRRIRLRRPDLPVLMLTARDDTRNKVGALDAGADDYLTKPSCSRSYWRAFALTRRAGQAGSAQIETDGLTIDLLSRHAWREDEKIELSSREFALLEYFLCATAGSPLQTADTLCYLGLRLRARLQRRRRLRAPPSQQCDPPTGHP